MSSVIDLNGRADAAAAVCGPPTGIGGFPLWRRAGDMLYLGAHLAPSPATAPAAAPPSIEADTHAAFARLADSLQAAGLGMADLVKLHTYYVFAGEGAEVTRYWERMTAVRLRYLADPGPAATALRVAGTPTRERLVSVDGVAAAASERQRLMPAHAWDWSIPTPFSQGWRIGTRIYVGGQISADRRGRTIDADDVLAQARRALEYIRHVLLEAGARWDDLVALKVCYRQGADGAAAPLLLERILSVVRQTVTQDVALSCLGIDLLYEGLVLEIDAVAVLGAGRQRVYPPQARFWAAVAGGCPAVRAGDEIHIGALSAPGGASLQAQAEATLERLEQVIEAAGATAAQLVKLNVFFCGDERDERRDTESLATILGQYLPAPRPALNLVRVAGLPLPGQRVQLDGIAIASP